MAAARPTKIALAWIAVTLLATGGCASVRPYEASLPDNLTFSSPGLKGSVFGSPKVSLHVFFAEKAKDTCELSYQGSVVLDPGSGPQQIGLPAGRDVYARIWVNEHNWLQNKTKTRSDEFLLVPRKGYRYDVAYIHKKKMYGRTIEETNVRTGRSKEVRPNGWGACAT